MLTQSLFHAFAGLAIASTVGVASSILMRWFCSRSALIHIFLSTITVVLLILFVLIAFPDGLLFLGGFLLFCSLASLADVASQEPKDSWLKTFFKLANATVFSVLLGAIALLFLEAYFSWNLSRYDTVWFTNGFLIGALCSPSVTSIFRWMWKNSQLRPGINRHFERDEHP